MTLKYDGRVFDLNEETGIPRPLDVFVRDLHAGWCDDYTEDDAAWHRDDADPDRAAMAIGGGILEMALDGTAESAAALQRLCAATLAWMAQNAH